MAADWRVTGQRQTSTLDGNGQFRDVMEVSFETLPEQISGRVSVPLNIYSEDTVRNAIDERAAAMKAVHNL